MGCLFPLQLFILSYVSLMCTAIINNSHVWHKKIFSSSTLSFDYGSCKLGKIKSLPFFCISVILLLVFRLFILMYEVLFLLFHMLSTSILWCLLMIIVVFFVLKMTCFLSFILLLSLLKINFLFLPRLYNLILKGNIYSITLNLI
jgi:hypothetical protein